MGSGPGALQISYALRALGIAHAVISADPSPGGMFRRWPFFQRLLSWTKPYAPVERGSRTYERFDWNSLLADEPENRALMPTLMDGSSYFPARAEMEANIALYAERTRLDVRYDCRWESTHIDGGTFTLGTPDGEYRCGTVVLAVGVAQPWLPSIPGIQHTAHYADTRAAETYADRRVFLIGKEVSAFELATGLLPWARQIVLASPSPAKLSVVTNSLVGVRARYVQPYEDHVLGGGVVLIDAAIQEVARLGDGFRVRVRRSDGAGDLSFDVDDVIAATGFTPPLGDLPKQGLATVGRNSMPAQTTYWESASVPGIFFAGTITQGSPGLKKHGIPSNSGAVHGARYNARVLAAHIARTRFGVEIARPQLRASEVVPYLIDELAHGPEIWHQRSYLVRVISFDRADGIRNEGLVPLAHFVDSGGPDAVGLTIESSGKADFYPAAYVRRSNTIYEHLLAPDKLLNFDTSDHRSALTSALGELIR